MSFIVTLLLLDVLAVLGGVMVLSLFASLFRRDRLLEAMNTYVCTAEHPWSKKKHTPVQHPDAVPDGGDYYACPWCGLRFKVPKRLQRMAS